MRFLYLLLLSFFVLGANAQLPVTSGNVLWLKADAAVYNDAGVTAATNGQTVQQWNDQSGNGNNVTQTTAGNRPVFQTAAMGTQPALFFDGAVGTKYLNNTISNLVTAGGARTTFIVSKINASSTIGGTIFTFRRTTALNSLSLGLNAGTNFIYTDGVAGANNASTATNIFNIAKNPFIVTYSSTSGTKVDYRFNTVNQIVSQAGAVSTESGTAGFTVGGREDLASWWQGLISEIIVYDRVLTLAEKQQVEAYLQTKYGITCSATASSKSGSGNALFMPGSGSYGAYTPASTDFDFGNSDFGIECWLNPGGSAQDNCIMTRSVGGAATAGTSAFYFCFNANAPNSMSLGFYTTAGTSWTNLISTPSNSLVQSKWQHVAVIRKAGVTNMYINGIQQTTTGTVVANIPVASQPLEIGAQNFTPYMGGGVDEVRIYKGGAPDQTVIRDWMCKKTTASHPYFANMVANYNFDEDAASTFAIDKINCHSMYLYGASVFQKSGASIGNTSAYNYTANTATANVNFGTPTDNLTATMNAGTSAGVHVYGVNELPNSQGYPGLVGNNKYAGVFVVNGNGAAAYNATYNYTNNTAVNPTNEPSLKLFKRTDNAATLWSQATNQTLNTGTKTITVPMAIGSQNTEYVLASVQTPVPPTCYGSFPNAGDLLNRASPANSYTLLDNNVDNFTYEFWANPTQPLGPSGTSGDRYIVWPEQANSLGKTGIGIGVAVGTNGIRVYGHTAGYLITQLGFSYTFTGMTHIAVVYAAQVPSIYINGILAITGTANGTARASDGFMQTDFYGHYFGQATDFRLWNYARTGAEINNGMNTPPAINAAGLQTLILFDNLYNGSGQLIKNKCTNLPLLNLDKITAGTTNSPAFNCTGNNLPAQTIPNCAAQFNGTSQATVGSLGTMPNKGTIEFWMNQSSFGYNQIPLSTISTSVALLDGIYFQTLTTGQLYVTFANGSSNANLSQGLYGTLVANRSYHVTVTWDLTSLTYKGYLDGRLIFIQPLVYYPTTLARLNMGSGYLGGQLFNGTLDEIRYWNVERTQTEILNNANTLTGSESGLRAYYHFNENLLNGNGQTVLNKATATIGTLNATTVGYVKFPCSLAPPTCGITLGGTAGEGIQVPHNAALNNTTAFTYEAWIKPSTNVSNFRAIINKGGSPNNAPGLYINNGGSGTAGVISAYYNIGGTQRQVNSTSTVNDNEWHHVATTYDGATLKVYIDGVLQNSLAATGALATNANPLTIGYNFTENNYPFIGTIDEVRVWNIARTDAELQTTMNTSLLGTESGLQAYYHFNNNDRSGQSRTVTNFCTVTGSALNGLTYGTSLTPLFSCAPPPFTNPECNMLLNGSTDFVEVIGTNPALSLHNFTIAAYIKTTDNSGAVKAIVAKATASGTTNYAMYKSAANKIFFGFMPNPIISGGRFLEGTTIINDGLWHYVVGTYDGANVKIYVDGVLDGILAATEVPLTSTLPLKIGEDGGSFRWNGSLDEISIWNTALSQSQITNLIGQQLAGNETNLAAYYNFDGINKSGQNINVPNLCSTTGAALNGTTGGTAATPIFTCSEVSVVPPLCNLLMNGGSDKVYLTKAGGITYPTVTNNFTMEVKAKALYTKGGASGAQYDGVFSGQNFVLFPDQAGGGFAPGHAGVGISLGTNGVAVYEHSTNYMPARIALNNYNTNDWVHLTVVSTNGILKLYINGALVSTVGASGYVLHPSGDMGGYWGNAFAGYVGEVRVWNASLTSEQIRTNLNATLTGAETNLISLFKFGNNTANGNSKTITGLGSVGSANPYITTGTACTPIFTCANTNAVNRDAVVGSGNMISQNGAALSFAEIGDVGNTPPQGSMMAWFNASTVKEKAFVFSSNHFRNSKGGYKGINLFTRGDGKLQLTFGTDTTVTGFQDTVLVANIIQSNRWYHFAMSWDTVAKTYTTYINGIQTATGTTNYWPTKFESFKAGIGLQPTTTYAWNGKIDELSMWNKILSLTEIRDQLAKKINTTQANYANLTHYYRFDNNTCGGNAISDYKGTVHGMIYNTSLPTSSAPLGDTSRYDYSGTTSSASVPFGLVGKDTIAANISSGTNVQGLHVYGINEKPNTQNGQIILVGNDRYGGVFVAADTNQLNYNLKYSYNVNPHLPPTYIHDQLLLYKRTHNADGTWVLDVTASVDSIAKTYNTTGRNSEYMLGYSLVPVRPHLGPDTTVFFICDNETYNLLPLYNTGSFATSWSTGTPTASTLGSYTLIATSSFGFKDTAVATVAQKLAVWTGSVSNDWHTAANWNGNKIPDSTYHVIIPAGTANPCVISTANAFAASVQAKTSSNFTIINNRILLIAASCGALPVWP
jgi:hypothetical protein